ncbi:twin-arginine translocase subunit TatC [Verrucomicrobiota bacterium]
MNDTRMSFVQHLGELRRRLISCTVATLLGMIVAYCVYDPWILDALRGPLDSVAGRMENPFAVDSPLLGIIRDSSAATRELNLDLHFIGPMEGFMVKLKAAFFGGLVLASPFIFCQIWAFLSCGLTGKERKAVRIFLPLSLVLFAGGLLIAYFIMLPIILYFLVIVTGKSLVPMLILSKYVSLVVMCCLAFGIIFEMPLVIYFLARLGLVSPEFLVRNRKYAILLMFIVAAMLTPPDIITQIMMGLPMMILYEASIWVSKGAWARRQKALAERET